MLLVVTKMVELLARAAFTVSLTFMLPLAAAGKFGLLVTLIGLFAFAFGWERHIDVQRRLVGHDAGVFDHAVTQMARLWLVNYLWMLPLFGLILLGYADVSLFVALLVLVIAMCEQVSNSAYNLAVVERRYHALVIGVAAKNLLLLLLSLALIFLFPTRLSLQLVLEFWAAVSLAATLAILLVWRLRRQSPTDPMPDMGPAGAWAQHRASLTHFLTGLLAVLVLQIDRLVVGGLVPADQAGVYFRHVMLIAFAYQFFNVASYNRRMPEILSLARDAGSRAAQHIVLREVLMVGTLMVAGFGGAVAIDALSAHYATERWHIAISLLALLLAAALVRIIADFQALILNSRMRERRVLLNQIIAFAAGLLLMVTLTLALGIYGTAAAACGSAILYLILNLVAARTPSSTRAGVNRQ